MKTKDETTDSEKIIPTGCAHDCGGRCVLRVHVKEGRITRVESDTGDSPQLRACLRGRAYRQRFYAPDRLKFPLRRTGVRGEGKFERISWAEALDIVAAQLKNVKDKHGPASILYIGFAGNNTCILHNPGVVTRLLNMFGGFTPIWGMASCEGAVFACRATYGTLSTDATRDDLLNSKLILMWGWNPAETIWVPNTCLYLARAREAGTKIICLDPRYTDSTAAFAHQWIPIKPATDTAMLLAMANVIISENRQESRYIQKYALGFEKFRDYVLGIEDNVAKTPEWAEEITGVPACVTKKIALEYATTKPSAIVTGYAPGRTAYGEQFHRAAQVLSVMTGNVGVHGGSGAGIGRAPVGIQVGPVMPSCVNPVIAEYPYAEDQLLRPIPRSGTVHITKVWDSILEGTAGGYPSDIRLLYVTHANPLNQFPNTNKGVEALRKLDFVVVHEQFMTSTAKFADIVLPINTHLERNDIARPWTSGPYYIFNNKVVDSLYDSKSDFEICCELAPRLGIENYSDKDEEEWLKTIFKMSRDLSTDIPDYEEFKKTGVHKMKLNEPSMAFEKQIDDIEKYPFPTPSSKIEIYSPRLASLGKSEIPAIPKYIEPWEGPNSGIAKKYPLQLITTHLRRRTHSTFDNIRALKNLEQQTVWINTKDASIRGIQNGDMVRVQNDRGKILIAARVTERIMSGVVCIPQGAWFMPDNNGTDIGGCANVLTTDRFSPGGAFCSNSVLVEVKRA